MKIPAWMIAIAGATALAAPPSAPAGDVTKVPSHDLFLVIPLRVHILTSKDLDLTDARITDDEVARAVPRINAIWNKAGISFGLESIIREPAAQVGRFKAIVELNDGRLPDIGPFAYLLPVASRASDGLHAYIFRDLPFNGGYITGADAAILREAPNLNEVQGGGSDPFARVAARGLGLALGLKTRPDEVGLLSAGTNGIGLDEAEVDRARKVARAVPGALEVADAAKLADAATRTGDVARARQLWTWLSEVPGAGAAQARKRLQALPPTTP